MLQLLCLEVKRCVYLPAGLGMAGRNCLHLMRIGSRVQEKNYPETVSVSLIQNSFKCIASPILLLLPT